MGGANTVLTLVKVGDLWRVKIAWPTAPPNILASLGPSKKPEDGSAHMVG
jgi:hypothetical protein